MARAGTASAAGTHARLVEYGTYAPEGQICPACRQAIERNEPVRRGYRRPGDAVNLVPAYWHTDRCPQPAAPQPPITPTEEGTSS